MEECVESGKTKSIGVSNFNVNQLKDILNICKIKPVCNQIEVNPLCRNEEVVDFCLSNNIHPVAYTPLGAPDRSKINLLEDPFLVELAKKYNKPVSKIILKWLLQRQILIIPKSVTPSRIEDNVDVNILFCFLLFNCNFNL
jgi:diketogulonate reductase-like aldo/keto reductase